MEAHRVDCERSNRFATTPYGTTQTAGDARGVDWAQWGSLGRDDGGLNCAPEDRPRTPAVQRQRLRDVLRDRLAAAGWQRPDRSTYRGYRAARDGDTVARE